MPVNVAEMVLWLASYLRRAAVEVLRSGFLHGFLKPPSASFGPLLFQISYVKEEELVRIAGPFRNPLFENL